MEVENRRVRSLMQNKVFFSSILEDGYLLRVQVTGKSMAPFLKTGSYVTLAKTPIAELKIGDIIFCRCDDGSFKLHRLLLIKDDMLITKGDALWSPDMPVEKKNYYGKVLRIEQHRAESSTIRNMESKPVQMANMLIAITHRFKLHLLWKYVMAALKSQ